MPLEQISEKHREWLQAFLKQYVGRSMDKDDPTVVLRCFNPKNPHNPWYLIPDWQRFAGYQEQKGNQYFDFIEDWQRFSVDDLITQGLLVDPGFQPVKLSQLHPIFHREYVLHSISQAKEELRKVQNSQEHVNHWVGVMNDPEKLAAKREVYQQEQAMLSKEEQTLLEQLEAAQGLLKQGQERER